MRSLTVFLFICNILALCSNSVCADIILVVDNVTLYKTKIQDTVKISPTPEASKYPDFYKKNIDASGIPIIGSANVNDTALIIAKTIVIRMLKKIPLVRNALIANKQSIIIVAHSENMSDLPEYKEFDKLRDENGIVLNERLRGLGPTPQHPYCSCGEENLLCLTPDRYKGQSILVHEFAHAIAILGISYVDTTFRTNLKRIYIEAKNKGLWKNTYAMSNADEYFAVGVQCWFNVYKKSIPGDGVYNEVSTRNELRIYDPVFYKLLSKYFYMDDSFQICK